MPDVSSSIDTRIVLTGPIHRERLAELRRTLTNALEENPSHLHIQWEDPGLLDAAGLALLLAAYRQLAAEDGRMTISGLTPALTALFRLTGLEEYIDVRESDES